MENNFTLKIAETKDMTDVFNLSNDLVVRQNSFNQNPIPIEKHKEWFNKKITDNDCVFYTIRSLSDEFIGLIRFDTDDSDSSFWIITVHLIEQYRGKGLGTKIIKEASKKIFSTSGLNRIYAFVKEHNNASLKSFLSAGYQNLGTTAFNNNICYKLEYNLVNSGGF